MDATSSRNQIRAWFGLDEPRVLQTLAAAPQAVLLGLATTLFAHWAGDRIRIDDVEGRVEDIGVGLTRLRDVFPEATVRTRASRDVTS